MFDLASIGAGLPVAETIDSLPSTGNVVIQAPPGTGKTTLVPPALANHAAGRGKVIVTAPRRVAVRAAAQRLSTLSGTPEKVGFAIRGESRTGSEVEFVTPGVLLRRLLKDPELEGVAAVAIDEVHERQLDTDLVLGMCLELAELREDFRVIAMSATVDAQRFSQLMGAPVHTTEAVTYPLDIQYAPQPGRAAGSREFYGGIAKQAARQHESTLVFVPGVREVNLVCEELRGHNVFPLHGKQTTAEQDAALYTDEQRIVVATSIAESSLTVPGVRVVVDAGLARIPRRDAQRGMSGLVTVSTSKSSADQRAGRAGREGPGTVIRCYSQDDYQHFSPHTTPEILSADLTQAALFLDCWGAGPDFPLLDLPPEPALAAAHSTLKRIGATQELALLPTDPRLGASLLRHGRQAAPTIAALADAPTNTTDLTRRPAPQKEVKRLSRLVEDLGPADPGEVVATAYPEQVAKRVGEDYLLASGTRARLLDNSGLAGSPWLAIAEVTLSNAGNPIIRTAARIAESAALDAIGVTEENRAFLRGGRVRGVKVRAAGAIVLSETPVRITGDAAAQALAAGIREEGLGLFTFSEKAQSLKDRLRHLRAHYGDPWPDVDAADPAEWLGPELHQIAEGTPTAKIDMYPALQRLLPWPEATRLDELAPQRLPVPSGRNAKIDWSGERPVVHIKLQECFGLAESPEYCGNRVQFHLLSPAGHPLAVTDDLASFWSGPYTGVRADMRGRYPKHPWPEDPWNAIATARTKNRM
ncbi:MULTISPECIES: ATP-dependent helicase HrpB [unclassified Corynebacterium]|uniref:ATP-dependent helicase HrpB n=1 Tax=unclassified Corynebacterium TaxID=2624378 RepID=UPI0003B80541|nr:MULTISPECIES: ATP-dependent helicase HrpB [unclassified Corynebacterium]ERS52246.1 ATP-dependent helicase HrpB [Corynebacterium sp. KPL1855]ERS63223.1 ATP-dependent helicase HrpB [Corynebacterium sp. KPL1814]ERS78811.1 ATP-dependent helicase HrpB [Corynebacterium sp. KPL1859]